MANREIAVGEFRQRATEIIRQVAETREPITITRRGVAVAVAVAVAEFRSVRSDPEARLGSVTVLDLNLSKPVLAPEEWEAVR